MNKYNVVMEMNDSTVVTEYEPIKRKSDSYQSEQALENEFIRLLTEQGYDYLELIRNDDTWKKTKEKVKENKLPETIESYGKVAASILGTFLREFNR